MFVPCPGTESAGLLSGCPYGARTTFASQHKRLNGARSSWTTRNRQNITTAINLKRRWKTVFHHANTRTNASENPVVLITPERFLAEKATELRSKRCQESFRPQSGPAQQLVTRYLTMLYSKRKEPEILLTTCVIFTP